VKNRDHPENNRKKPQDPRENANHTQQHAFFEGVENVLPGRDMADNEPDMNDKESVLNHAAPACSRAEAWKLLTEWTHSESLRKHALGVEACVAAYGEAEADRLGLTGEAREKLLTLYATTALLHDFDYERHPSAEEHPFVGVQELERLGWPVETRTAILGHANYSGVPRVTHLDKVLFACDELSGFLTACALVKPTKAIADVEPAGVRKKLKDKAFARGVNREDVIQGAQELGVELDAHIVFCLAAMQKRAPELGL
jgi:predicted hydrolase (HD superfamily)